MALRQERAKLKDSARAITNTAEKESRNLSADEDAQIDALIASAEKTEIDIQREEKLADMDRKAMPAQGVHVEVIDRAALDQKGGFKSFGEFAVSVLQANTNQSLDQRLVAAAPTTYGNENTGADGGFGVPIEFAKEIRQIAFGADSFVAMSDENPISSNSMTFPRDETTAWGTNGVRAYWESEAVAATQTKPVIGTDTLRMRKLMALVPMTDELLADSTAMDRYITTKTGNSILYKTNDAMINGTGAGMPLGILNAGALVSVAKETSQAAATVNSMNIAKMFARMPATSKRTSVWLINSDVLPQIMNMIVGDVPIWQVDWTGGSPAGLLLGRPIIETESCKTLGTKGDIYFVDWKQYLTITKSSGVEFATSIHLYFDAGATAFRATYRIDGQPWLKSSITPANGSNNRSPFVSLDTRA